MKHIFTLIFLSATSIVSAQNLQIRSSTGTVLDGQTMVHAGLSTDAEILAENYYVHNIGSTLINVRCKWDELSVTAGTESAICWAACSDYYFPGEFPTLTAPGGNVPINPGDSVGIFVLHHHPLNNSGISLFKVTFYNASAPTDTSVFNIQFDVLTSVSEPISNSVSLKAYPIPANNYINIDVENLNDNATLKIVDALGVTVKTAKINGDANLKFNTADLRAGVYFYSLITDNKTILTRRLVITR